MPEAIEDQMEKNSDSKGLPENIDLGLAVRHRLLASGVLFALVLIFFGKNVFGDGNVSRIYLLAEWDSVFDMWRTGRSQAYDPSLVQIFFPDFYFLAHNLAKGILPLWNPHCGLGFPFLADIQTSVFSPLRACFDFFPSLKSYNCYLVLELLVCASGSYLLFLALFENQRFDKFLLSCAALLASFSYTFCPYNLWYLELGIGPISSLAPFVTLAFVRVAKLRSVGSAALAGAAAALLILSGHPECAFFEILFSAAVLILLILLGSSENFSVRIRGSSSSLLLAALSAAAFSAPVLHPFCEYLLNSQSYKFGASSSSPVSWVGILFNLSNPGAGPASPYLGVVVATLLPLSLLGLRTKAGRNRELQALLIATCVAFLLVSQLGPLSFLFLNHPLDTIITRYALPRLLLFLSLLGGCGFLQLTGLVCLRSPILAYKPAAEMLSLRRAAICLLLVSPLACLAFARVCSADPTLMKLADFDVMLPATALNQAAWRRDAAISLIFSTFSIGAIIAVSLKGFSSAANEKLRIPLPAYLAGLLALCLAFISEASVSKLSLPQQPAFFYPQTELLSRLKKDEYRIISTCEHVLRPATNAVYGLNMLTVHNPLFPARFLDFLKACGADADLYNQKFGLNLSPLINLASVKYVLSLKPVSDSAGSTEKRFALAFQSRNHIFVYENRDAAPRAYLVERVLSSHSAEESLRMIQAPDFNQRSSVVIERTGSSDEAIPSDISLQPERSLSGDRLDCQFDACAFRPAKSFRMPNPNSVEIVCQSARPSWLVLTDIYYPGWSAYLDGQKVAIERANFAFRAVRVGPGEHSVRFVYEPLSFIYGCLLFAGAAVLFLFLFISGLSKRRL